MSGIPLHIQRRFEQRWAVRFGTSPECKNFGRKTLPQDSPPVGSSDTNGLSAVRAGAVFSLNVAGMMSDDRCPSNL
jgi:hypothetical protein